MNLAGVVVLLIAISLTVVSTETVSLQCDPKLTNGGLINITETVLTTDIISAPFWLSGKTVLLLTKDGHIHRSTNGGQTWADQYDTLLAPISSVRVMSDRTHLILNSGIDIFVSTNAGGSYSKITPPKQMRTIVPHPSEPTWALGLAFSQGCTQSSNNAKTNEEKYCFNMLYYTQDLGSSWHLLDTYVSQVNWGPLSISSVDVTSIFYNSWTDKTGHQPGKSYWKLQLNRVDDFVISKKYQNIFDHCTIFVIADGVIWIGKFVSDKDATLLLYVSRNGGKIFRRTKFPYNPDEITQKSFSILDTSEGMAFIHVEHGASHWGHLYSSDDVDQDFSLSLEYNSRSRGGYVDFEKFNGIEGIYVANYISKGQTGTHSVISWDKGGEWHHMKGPEDQCKGQSVEHCHMNLFGASTGHSPFYSLPSALGLMIGLGNVGSELGKDVNTYVSRDAGYSWNEVAKGQHIYEFGDFGGLLVLARNDVPTNEISFSWNEGITMSNCSWTEDTVKIQNIMSGEGPAYGSSTSFIGFGKRDKDNKQVILHIDFSTLHERECVGWNTPDQAGSDYELWQVTGDGDGCMLGRNMQYIRRKPGAECHNGLNFESPKVVDHCLCTREDYVCDYCYEEKNEDTEDFECVLSQDCKESGYRPEVDSAPDNCVGTFNMTFGYRKVVGDSCLMEKNGQDGLDLNGKPHACPDGSSLQENTNGNAWIAILILFLIFGCCACLALAFAVVYYRNKDAINARLEGYSTNMGPSDGLDDIERDSEEL